MMIKYIFSFLLLTGIFKVNAQFLEAFTKIAAEEDTWVSGNEPDKNFGNKDFMSCAFNDNEKYNYVAYLKFNITEFPKCDSVTFSFWADIRGHNDLPFKQAKSLKINLVELLDTMWSADEISWNNRPKSFGKEILTIELTKGKKKYDVSSEQFINYVQKAKKQKQKYISFIIKSLEKTPDYKVVFATNKWYAPSLNCFYKHSNDLTVSISPDADCYKSGELQVEIKANEKSVIHYTTDGSTPSLNDPVYNNPIDIKKDTEIQAFAAQGDKKSHFYSKFYHVRDEKTLALTVDMHAEKKVLPKFWNTTGFSPAEIALRPDMQQTCEFMGSIPHNGLVYVRPHYLLNLLAVEGIETNTPRYNWTKLDSVLDLFVQNGLKPIFELMGTPSSSLNKFSTGFDKDYQAQTGECETFFTNFKEKEKLYAWKRLVKDIALHYIERYGREEVRSWYFETVNEPNLSHFWKYTLPDFLNYYDACSEGLREADPEIKFGGPGHAGGLGDFFEELIAHCDTGINYFTGEKGVRIDFFTVHIKNNPDKMIESEVKVYQYIKENHPRFANVPLGNDESDPTFGWRSELWWRPLPWYAAFVAQSADYHYQYFIDSLNVNYGILSNDNAFMGNWYNRTQLARFADPENPACFSMVKKPCFTVNTMLSKLGSRIIDCNVPEQYKKHIGIIPTLHTDGKIAVILYNKTPITIKTKEKNQKDSISYLCNSKTIDLKLQNLPLKNYTLVEYRIDPENANPYKMWERMGMPDKPTTEQIVKMREAQEIALNGSPVDIKINAGTFIKSVSMPSSSVVLLMLISKEKTLPQKPSGLRISSYSGINNEKEVMIQWNDLNNYYIKTFEVWFSEDNSKFEKVNLANFIENGYLLTLNDEVTKGYIKVRAIDFWGREGTFSETLYFE